MGTEKDAILLLGSNLGDRIENLKTALSELEVRIGKCSHASSFYETEPWGMETGKWFMNQCIAIPTGIDPSRIMGIIRDIETGMGREDNNEGYRDRVIDIDILLYGDLELHAGGLVIPHPRIRERKFALLPLLEIFPELTCPPAGERFADILDACSDDLTVRKIQQ
jgi:2-amino-4-hydroxy-6-hydroxymethyldihydropteridine diphosphokinase